MKTWKLQDAAIHFNEILPNSAEEFQMVIDEEKPLAVVINIQGDKNFIRASSQDRPTISELLDELHKIQEDETVEIEIPSRQDRTVEFERGEKEDSPC